MTTSEKIYKFFFETYPKAEKHFDFLLVGIILSNLLMSELENANHSYKFVYWCLFLDKMEELISILLAKFSCDHVLLKKNHEDKNWELLKVSK